MPKIEQGTFLKINVPEWFRRFDFVEWLNKTGTPATWHVKGEAPGGFSDVFIVYDHGEGSDSHMPEAVWQEICEICEHEGLARGIVWLTNLAE